MRWYLCFTVKLSAYLLGDSSLKLIQSAVRFSRYILVGDLLGVYVVAHLADLTSILMPLFLRALFSGLFLNLQVIPGGHMSDQHFIWEVVVPRNPRACR